MDNLKKENTDIPFPEVSVFKYYSTQRPISLGSYPVGGDISIENYKNKTYVESIGREAWGEIHYGRSLSEKEMSDYKLIPDSSNMLSSDKVQEEEIGNRISNRDYIKIHYEKINQKFIENEKYNNFNDREYILVAKFSENTFFMQDTKSREYIVAIDVKAFKRYPSNEIPNNSNTEIGIMWEHGRYLGKNLIDIDIYSLKKEFSPQKKINSINDFDDKLKQEFCDLDRIIVNDNLPKRVKEAANHEIYEKFGTNDYYEFLERLDDGFYDNTYAMYLKEINLARQDEYTYEITITETLSRKEKVKAIDLQDAIKQVEDKYYKLDIVLDAEDCEGVIFDGKIIPDNKISNRETEKVYEMETLSMHTGKAR